MKSLKNSRTRFGEVLIVEDNNNDAKLFSAVLRNRGLNVQRTDNLDSFRSIIQERDFDVVSIDWDINGFKVGDQVLETSKRSNSLAGYIVYTVWEKVQISALSSGADYFLVKYKDNYEDCYVALVDKCLRLGIIRKINNILYTSGMEIYKDVLQPSKFKNCLENYEKSVYQMAFGIEALKSYPDEKINSISELARKRGVWEEFDLSEFNERSKWSKLHYLLSFARVDSESLSKILEVSSLDATKFMDSGEFNLIGKESDADHLLSVLSYSLKLSEYDPELLPRYIHIENLYNLSFDPPPWDKIGIHKYLCRNGLFGLNEAIGWIRGFNYV